MLNLFDDLLAEVTPKPYVVTISANSQVAGKTVRVRVGAAG